jgi:hypothetical protein
MKYEEGVEKKKLSIVWPITYGINNTIKIILTK